MGEQDEDQGQNRDPGQNKDPGQGKGRGQEKDRGRGTGRGQAKGRGSDAGQRRDAGGGRGQHEGQGHDAGGDAGGDGGKKPYRKLDWRYTETRRRKFLRVLAETYDIEAACDAGELTWPQVCEMRVRHPGFAARFEEVIVAGYDRLEALLLRHSGVAGNSPIDPALAQALLKQRRMGRLDAGAGGRGGGRGGASKGGRAGPSRDEMMHAIVDRLAPLKAAQARGSKGNGAAARPAR